MKNLRLKNTLKPTKSQIKPVVLAQGDFMFTMRTQKAQVHYEMTMRALNRWFDAIADDCRFHRLHRFIA